MPTTPPQLRLPITAQALWCRNRYEKMSPSDAEYSFKRHAIGPTNVPFWVDVRLSIAGDADHRGLAPQPFDEHRRDVAAAVAAHVR